MTKIRMLALAAALVLLAGGCAQAQQEMPVVLSFCGTDGQFSVSNGVIVLGAGQEVFYGGQLEASEDFAADAVSFSATFYCLSGDEKKTLLSSSVTDRTGGRVRVGGDLGKVSGEGAVSGLGEKAIKPQTLKNGLYFELEVTDAGGRQSIYPLQLSVTEVTAQENK